MKLLENPWDTIFCNCFLKIQNKNNDICWGYLNWVLVILSNIREKCLNKQNKIHNFGQARWCQESNSNNQRTRWETNKQYKEEEKYVLDNYTQNLFFKWKYMFLLLKSTYFLSSISCHVCLFCPLFVYYPKIFYFSWFVSFIFLRTRLDKTFKKILPFLFCFWGLSATVRTCQEWSSVCFF